MKPDQRKSISHSNPLEAQWRRRQNARHEIDNLRRQSDEAILAKARAVVGFASLESIYGFHIDRFHPDTLQLSFGNRSMFRLTIDLKKTAAENGPSLLYSLGHTGFFSTMLYPAKSDIARTHEDYLFLQIGETSSIKLIEGMESDLKMLVAYAHVSSIDMMPTLRERVGVGLLRWFSYRGEKGEFKRPPIWRGILGLASFGARTFATASFLSLLKPLGVAILLILLASVGLDGLESLVRSITIR
jgi:hypothetical protein